MTTTTTPPRRCSALAVLVGPVFFLRKRNKAKERVRAVREPQGFDSENNGRVRGDNGNSSSSETNTQLDLRWEDVDDNDASLVRESSWQLSVVTGDDGITLADTIGGDTYHERPSLPQKSGSVFLSGRWPENNKIGEFSKDTSHGYLSVAGHSTMTFGTIGTMGTQLTAANGGQTASEPSTATTTTSGGGPNHRGGGGIRDVYAPAGRLGLFFDIPKSGKGGGPPVVRAVREFSPLLGEVRAGDCLLALDEVDVTNMRPEEIARLMTERKDNVVRRLRVGPPMR